MWRRLLVGVVLSTAFLFGPSAALAGDRGGFGDNSLRWKRAANFASDRTFGIELKRRRSVGVKRVRKRRSAGPEPVPAFRPDQLLVAFSLTASEDEIDKVADDHDMTRVEDITIALLNQRIVKFQIPPAQRRRLASALSNDARIETVQPNHLYVLGSSDSSQYALEKLNLQEVHKFADGTDIRIALLDSGVNRKHPVFGGLQIEQFDATDGTAERQDDHGTAVASLIAAQTGMTGIVPNADLLSARTFTYSGRWQRTVGETYYLLQGLDWAVLKGARVFNMSFAGPKDALMRAALEATLKTDAVIIAAAGNNGRKAAPAYPAAYEGVIAVTATDKRNRLYRHANRGKYIFVAAPGVNILSAKGQEGFSRKSGTSMAAAHVTGIVALMMQSAPDATSKSVAEQLAATANDLGKDGRDDAFGYGMINPVALVSPPSLTN
ncbi:MAG: S8 family serine peptidase [Pseudomonadota bacterium]